MYKKFKKVVTKFISLFQKKNKLEDDKLKTGIKEEDTENGDYGKRFNDDLRNPNKIN